MEGAKRSYKEDAQMDGWVLVDDRPVRQRMDDYDFQNADANAIRWELAEAEMEHAMTDMETAQADHYANHPWRGQQW
jgi:hypothetical protein